MKSFHSHSREETLRLGQTFAETLKNGDVVALSGDLGTGKTHFIVGVCAGLGVRSHVASPTFTFINEYRAEGRTVVHVDLYRIASNRELFELGVTEYFTEQYICLIEWAERMAEYLPLSHIEVKIAYGKGENDRVILINERRENAKRAGSIAV
jgi:tRNA threonylcarbamoyladenosine biosynthesis protein TsaE